MKTWTHTSEGKALDLANPLASDVSIPEIARSLSQQCRYAGNTLDFYSVAEHSVLICDWLYAQHGSRDLALAGLLHDAAEAYTGDITFPMQRLLFSASPAAEAAYKACQAKLDDIICAKAGIPSEYLHYDAVKQADMRILLDERARLLTMPAPRPWSVETELGLQPLGVPIRCMVSYMARYNWLVRYNRYSDNKID